MSFWKCSTAAAADMMRARLLVWMIAAIALLAPPGMTVQAMAPPGEAASVDCTHHAPPDPCPDHDTSRHAAGVCCPLMSGAVALLPAAITTGETASSQPLPQVRLPNLVGRVFTQDPPPPRV
jgi:hypothetical protein